MTHCHAVVRNTIGIAKVSRQANVCDWMKPVLFTHRHMHRGTSHSDALPQKEEQYPSLQADATAF
jgi:hypothetical protein